MLLLSLSLDKFWQLFLLFEISHVIIIQFVMFLYCQLNGHTHEATISFLDYCFHVCEISCSTVHEYSNYLIRHSIHNIMEILMGKFFVIKVEYNLTKREYFLLISPWWSPFLWGIFNTNCQFYRKPRYINLFIIQICWLLGIDLSNYTQTTFQVLESAVFSWNARQFLLPRCFSHTTLHGA